MSYTWKSAAWGALFGLVSCSAWAHLGPLPVSARGAAVPPVPGLLDGPEPIVVNRERAIALGKALFWDMAVGSDGVACATCHFSAGADARTRNQRAPTSKSASLRDGRFSLRFDGQPTGPNDRLRRSDFPLVQTAAPLVEGSPVIRKTDDSIGSAGVFTAHFHGVEVGGSATDLCARTPDPVFHVGAVGTRRVEARNAPSIFNAVFNHRQLWDGAANNHFNGVNQWGARDPDAAVWTLDATGRPVRTRLLLKNASLASQAVSVPVNADEMSCAGRTFPDLARKLLQRKPLANQHVHWNDSVLGPLANATRDVPARGLKPTYMQLVRSAFDRRYWGDLDRNTARYGTPAPNASDPDPVAYNQIEANFALFFGLALQLYQSTLVSDDSPFDRSARDAEGVPVDLSESAQRGMQIFREAHCNLCHVGPHFTSAAVAANAALVGQNPQAFGAATITLATTDNVVTRLLGNGRMGFIDTGYAATGVGEDEWDAGLAARDPFGHPLSFAEQYLDYLAGQSEKVVDPEVFTVRACDLQNPIALNTDRTLGRTFTRAQGVRPQPQATEGCYNLGGAFVPEPVAAASELISPQNQRMHHIARSAFKIPNLRNVELTGPYMHNGSMASLEEVIEFYTRGGNFDGADKQGALVFGQPQLEFDAQARADLLAFLKSLTDERVRHARAPFDHPQLFVPHGHIGDEWTVVPGNPVDVRLARDGLLHLPAVGAEGNMRPLIPFVERLAD